MIGMVAAGNGAREDEAVEFCPITSRVQKSCRGRVPIRVLAVQERSVGSSEFLGVLNFDVLFFVFFSPRRVRIFFAKL